MAPRICAAAIFESGLDHVVGIDAQDSQIHTMLAKILLELYLLCRLQACWRLCSALSYAMTSPYHEILNLDVRRLEVSFCARQGLFDVSAFLLLWSNACSTMLSSCILPQSALRRIRYLHAMLGRPCLPSGIHVWRRLAAMLNANWDKESCITAIFRPTESNKPALQKLLRG